MKYHKLDYIKEENGMAGDSIVFRKIIFDGQQTDYIFDEAALKVSSEKDGIYPLVVCSCDIIGCGGMYVSTRIDGDDIVWEKFWCGQCVGKQDEEDELKEFSFFFCYGDNSQKLIIKPPLRFKLEEYKKIADELIATVYKDTPVRDKENADWVIDTIKQYREGDTGRI